MTVGDAISLGWLCWSVGFACGTWAMYFKYRRR